MDPEDVRRKITAKTKLIIINSPQNPTGSVMSKDQILEIARIAEENDTYLLSDEVYARIVYDGLSYSPAVADKCRERTIILNSLSKVYSMSGWRLGYAVGPENLITKLGLLLQTILSCLPPFTQWGGVATLKGDHHFLDERIKTLRARRDRLVKGLNELTGVSCVVPGGSFYAFPNIRGTGMSSDEYTSQLLEETGVCSLSGNCFGRFGEGYVRLCYASTPIEVLEEALTKMKKFHDKRCKVKMACRK